MSVPSVPTSHALSLPAALPARRLARAAWVSRAVRLASTLVTASLATSFVLVVADAVLRRRWQGVDVGRHWLAALVLYAAWAGLVGLAATVLVLPERLLSAGATARWRRAGAVVAPAWYAVAAAAASVPTAFWLFSGRGVQQTILAPAGPYVCIAFVGCSAALGGSWLSRSRQPRRGARARHHDGLVVGLCAAGAAILGYADQTWFVALYTRLHAALEAVAVLLLMCAFVPVLAALRRRWPGVEPIYGGVAVSCTACGLLLAGSGGVRTWTGDQLAHAWRQPVYVDRMVGRLQRLDAWLTHGSGGADDARSRVERILRRYDIASTALAPEWEAPAPPDRQRAAERAAAPLRGRGYDLVFFYIDTLRHDAAHDAAIMPNLVRFARQSLDFRRAYGAASDTVEAIQPLLTCRYVRHPDDETLLTVARRAGVDSALVISQSAAEFLEKHVPSFHFDETIRVADYEPGRQVWGYGADRPTAQAIVDRGLSWLRSRDPHDRSLLWLFHYDLHSWREVEEDYVHAAAKRLQVPDEAPLNWRYRVVARTVDEELGRFLAGLADLGRAESTVVVLLGDHGEGLGRDGFWVHGVFLWDPLIHVPLVVRIPGVRPAVVEAPVGHVDFLPTLGPLLATEPSFAHCHGENLLLQLERQPPPRRLPLLMASMQGEELLRVGLIDPGERLKLVLPLESGIPELHDLTRGEPDDVEISAERRRDTLRLLSELVRSPVFPRPSDTAPPAQEPERAWVVEPRATAPPARR